MLRAPIYVIRHQFLGLLALVLVLGGYVDAATGGNFVLGRLNTAGTTSVLRNTGTGAALSLKVASGQQPLEVNSSKVVAGLNAALLGGYPASAFAPVSGDSHYVSAGTVYTKSESDTRFISKTANLPRTLQSVHQEEAIPGAATVVRATATCPDGYRLVSGGGDIVDTATAYLVQSYGGIIGGKDVWTVLAVNPPGFHLPGTLTATAFCSPKGKPVVP